jgi:hypothetical protein
MEFIMPHDIYCYTAMTFGLKNTGATYQKAIQNCLESQIGKNVEAYVDDVVVKTTAEDDLIADLAKTFASLRLYRWKLNPEKCVFGVPSGKLLGFRVSHRGIKANPTKVDAIRKMKRPDGKKDVMKFTDMMVALGHFISKLGEKGLPFFKLLKKSDKFEWIDEADQTLEELKTFLSMPPVMVPPVPKETLLLYISASTQVVSAVLVEERPEEGHPYPVQRPVYYVSEVLSDSKIRYSQPQEMLYALLITLRKLRHYFQSHKIKVVSSSLWEKSYTTATPCGASSSGRLSWANSSLSFIHDKPSSPRSSQTSSLSGQRPNNPHRRRSRSTGRCTSMVP